MLHTVLINVRCFIIDIKKGLLHSTEYVQIKHRCSYLEKLLNTIVDNISLAVYAIRIEGKPRVTIVSQRLVEWTGYTRSELIQTPFLWYDCIHPKDRAGIPGDDKKALPLNQYPSLTYRIIHRVTKEVRCINDHRLVLKNETGDHGDILCILEQRESFHKMEEVLLRYKELLDALEQNDSAQLDEYKNYISNIIETRVYPYIKTLRSQKLCREQHEIIEIIEDNLYKIAHPLHKNKDLLRNYSFTPMEMKVADLVRFGKSSDEISSILCISPRTVRFHRTNIRKKLNLTGTKTSLQSFLLSLEQKN